MRRVEAPQETPPSHPRGGRACCARCQDVIAATGGLAPPPRASLASIVQRLPSHPAEMTAPPSDGSAAGVSRTGHAPHLAPSAMCSRCRMPGRAHAPPRPFRHAPARNRLAVQRRLGQRDQSTAGLAGGPTKPTCDAARFAGPVEIERCRCVRPRFQRPYRAPPRLSSSTSSKPPYWLKPNWSLSGRKARAR